MDALGAGPDTTFDYVGIPDDRRQSAQGPLIDNARRQALKNACGQKTIDSRRDGLAPSLVEEGGKSSRGSFTTTGATA